MAKTLKGLSLDTRPQEQPEGTYAFGKNGIQFDTKGAIINEPGFDPTSVTAPGEVIGIIETDSRPIVFSVDTNAVSHVGFFDRVAKTYTEIKNDSTFPAGDKWGFSRDHFITGEAQRNFKNQIVVAWTDKNKYPRMMNCEDTADITSAKDTLLFLQAQTPTMEVTLDSGGILEKGAHFVAVKLLKNDGSETGYLTISKPQVASSNTSSTVTDKALNITLSNLDQSYDKVQLAIISRINGSYKASVMDPVEIIPGTLTAQYTGEQLTTPITLDEILVPNAVYSKVGTIGQLNDALYIADLEKEPEINMQQYANLIKLRVKSELIDVVPGTPDHVNGKKKSLMHQEVYSVYVRYHRTVGGWTGAFHIPGNTPLTADLNPASGVHEVDLAAKEFQVHDTNRGIDVINKTCDTGIWVNDDETYPDLPQFDSSSIGGRNLRGLKVMHHRMPSIKFCKDNFYQGTSGAEGDYGRSKLDILSLEVSNVIIPANLQGTIDGYEILIGKRTLANSTVLGQSLMLVSAQANDKAGADSNFMSTGGNWNTGASKDYPLSLSAGYNAFNACLLTGRDRAAMKTGTSTGAPGLRFRLHSFDMLFNKPAITPSFMAPQLKLRRDNINKPIPAGGSVEDGDGGDNVGFPIIYQIDYTKGTSPTSIASNQRVRAIQDTKYLPNNTDVNEHTNNYLEACYTGKLKWVGLSSDIANNDLPLNVPRPWVRLKEFQVEAFKVPYEETYLVNLMDVKENLYNSFYAQPLVAAGQFVPITSSNAIVYCGDTFLNDYSYHTYGWFDGINNQMQNTTDFNKLSGVKVVRRFVCEAVSNINLRYEDASNRYSKWWPNSPLTLDDNSASGYLHQFDRTQDPNQFGYNKDLNTPNDFGNYTSFNPYSEDISAFPFRIHRGGKMPRQGKTRSWRTFLPLDYYEMQKNMGRIKKVLGKDDKLLIHCENALFRTQDKAKLDAGNLSVTLGSGDIFQFEPQEAMSAKQGYAGTQHELAAVDTPWGYVFADARQGQVFLFKDGIKLMNAGLNKFIQEQLKTVKGENVFTGNGLTIGYDPEYKRILVTVKNAQVTSSVANFVPNYVETEAFIQTLVAGQSVVYRGGRYVMFLGPNPTAYACATNTQPTGTNGSITIAENTANGTLVHNIASLFSDPDGDALSYVIMGGNTNGGFTLNPVTGDLRVANTAALDFETQPTFSLVIRGKDAGGLYVDITYTVNLTNVNEAPLVHNYEWYVSEDAATGFSVGQVIGVDPEGTAMTYSIETPGVPFAINAATGAITTTGALDYETTNLYILTVKVCDAGSACSFSTVKVIVTNVSEAPVGVDATVNVYRDTVLAGATIHTVSYSDGDNDTMTIEWVNQAALDTKFSFNPTTGVIKILNPTAVLPGESYVLDFLITDSTGATDHMFITVNILVASLVFSGGDFICIAGGCAAGYTLSPDGSYCYQYSDTAATPPTGGTPVTTETKTYSNYSEFGSLIYSPGYAADGTGPYTRIDITNAWWRNIPPDVAHGPLNRCGLWVNDGDPSTDNPLNTPVGFTVAINIPTTKTYYVAIAGDNKCQIKVNGVSVVSQDPTTLASNISTIEGIGYGVDVAFKFWHIYPVSLVSGQNYIEVTGINNSSQGSFGAEIYNNTAAELAAATSYAGLNLIFSSKDYRGQDLQLGSGVAWTCPAGYSLVETSPGTYTCRQILTSAPTSVTTKHYTTILVKDGTGAQLAEVTNVAGQSYMGQSIPYQIDVPSSPDC